MRSISMLLVQHSKLGGTGRGGRGRVLALAVVLVLLVPVVALAAENTVPGDLLYPIKRAVEPIVQVFDSDAPAQRRVREVEVLFERDATDEVIVRHVEVARDVITNRHPTLSQRIDRVVHDLDIRRTDRLGLVDSPDKPDEERPIQEKPIVSTDISDGERGDDHPTSTTSTTQDLTSDTTRSGDRQGDS